MNNDLLVPLWGGASALEQPALQFTSVSRTHGTGGVAVQALTDVSFALNPGEVVAVMGPSGSGKSTLLAIAGGLDQPTEGKVEVFGEDMAVLSARARSALRRRRIGYVFQNFNLIDGLTAAENVALPLELDHVRRRKALSMAHRALQRVGLAGLSDRFPDQLSGGEQQRVAIARATVGSRELLLADEPTGSLDSATGESVIALLADHADRGGAAILVTHDRHFAEAATRILQIRDGRVDQTA